MLFGMFESVPPRQEQSPCPTHTVALHKVVQILCILWALILM